MKILAIAGSLQKSSSNKTLLNAIASRAPRSVEMVFCTLIGEIPHYNADMDTAEPPQAVAEWRAQVSAADGVLISSPEYGHGVPGSLKNALDWIVGSGEFVHKPVAATCAAQGQERGLLGLASLLQTLRAVDAKIVWSEPLIVTRTSLDERDQITDPQLEQQIDALLSALLAVEPD